LGVDGPCKVLNLGIFCPEKLVYKVGNSIDKNFLKILYENHLFFQAGQRAIIAQKAKVLLLIEFFQSSYYPDEHIQMHLLNFYSIISHIQKYYKIVCVVLIPPPFYDGESYYNTKTMRYRKECFENLVQDATLMGDLLKVPTAPIRIMESPTFHKKNNQNIRGDSY